jgi:Sec-independent protein translocase protein TatA
MLLSIDPKMLEAIATIAWPLIVVIAIIVLGPHIYRIVKHATDVTVEIGEYKFTASQYTAEILIKPIKDELDESVVALTDDQKKLFREIYQNIEGERQRYFVPDDFQRQEGTRESKLLKNYRALRNVNFIRPTLGGRWEAKKEVQIKNFGRLAAKMKQRELGFQK